MSWTDQNELMRLGKKLLDATGTNTPSERSMISQLASSTNVGYKAARDAYVKAVLDPLLQDKVRKSMKWLIHANFVPEFVDSETSNAHLDESSDVLDPLSIKPDGIQTPKRMFNLDTGNLEDYPSGQYVILSHCWKGQELTYPFISKIKENRKKKEAYEMLFNDPNEEARRFASFKAQKFGHLETGQSDVELLGAQCNEDIKSQVQKISAVLSRSGTKSDTRELLAQLAEFKEAAGKETSARKSFISRRKELEERKIADKVLEKEKRDAGLDASDDTEVNNDVGKGLAEAEDQLLQAKKLLAQAEDRLSSATTNFQAMKQDHALRSAVEDLLPVLERKKSVNKIEQSIREAKRILDLGLFPSNSPKRYLWNDTICINKGDPNELTESLARMGEWYSNADYCLVNLDTSSPSEWLSTWDHLEKPPEVPNYRTFDDVYKDVDKDYYNDSLKPKWSTRGWTLQELILSKMTFFVNNLWQPLTRSVEGLGLYYYHCSYLDQHIEEDFTRTEANSILEDSEKLRELMDAGEKIEYISYPGDLEKSQMLIGILNYLGVHFPRDMDDDNSSAHIRNTISLAAYHIETRLSKETPDARLSKLFDTLGFDMTSSIRPQAKTLIRILLKLLVKDCAGAIDEDRKRISKFTSVTSRECCRGLARSIYPAYDILSLASFRECTVPIDGVYSLMGVLGVKFPVFYAEGQTRALYRLLDEVVIGTNDISIFNWAGKDLGSPIRGRSLYPSSLNAFSPNESYFNSRMNDVLAKISKEKRETIQHTASHLSILLRRTIEFVKRATHQDVPIDLIRSVLDFIQNTSLGNLKSQLVNLGKILIYVEDTQRYEEYKPKTRLKIKSSSPESVVNEDEKTTTAGSIASRFGIKTPQLPQISAPKISAPKINVGRFYGKKSAAKEPETVKASPPTPPTPSPVETPVIKERIEPETLVGEMNDWVSNNPHFNDVPDDFQPLFKNLPVPNFGEFHTGRHKPKETNTPFVKHMICPNPIMLTTSGIEGIFDIQRVIITMQNPAKLRSQIKTAASENQKISGQCTISTGLSTITVDFSCTAGILGPQLDVCDVVERVLSDPKSQKARGNSTQTGRPGALRQESYYSRLSGLIRTDSQASDATETDNNSKQETQEEETENQAFGETEEQRRVCRMLDFVQETNIDLIVGEWVLARFTGAEGAKWFLCLLELGSTHSYCGRRIATDDIDFKNVVPESGLVGHWDNYMHNKKTELCRIVDIMIQGRMARRYAEEVTGAEKENDKASELKAELDEDSDNEGPEGKEKLLDIFFKRGTLMGAELVQNVADMWGGRLDRMLSDNILASVPKTLRAAILNLNENEDLLPAMFLSGIQVHMF